MGAAGHDRADTEAPGFLPSGELYRRARQIEGLARIIMDCTSAGSRCRDIARASRLLTEIGALAGTEVSEQ